jgi:hypothetical protein
MQTGNENSALPGPLSSPWLAALALARSTGLAGALGAALKPGSVGVLLLSAATGGAGGFFVTRSKGHEAHLALAAAEESGSFILDILAQTEQPRGSQRILRYIDDLRGAQGEQLAALADLDAAAKPAA